MTHDDFLEKLSGLTLQDQKALLTIVLEMIEDESKIVQFEQNGSLHHREAV